MAEKPVCGKCGVAHWRFVPCAEAGVANEMEEARARRRERMTVRPVWRSDTDREWGDRLDTYTTSAGPGARVFWRRRHDGPEAA